MKMKLKISLVLAYLLMSTTAFAELSAISTQRLKQGVAQCEEVNNELVYKEYWKDSVKPENLKAVCMAERFADQVATDGDTWLEKESAGLIEQCGNESNDRESYFSCLRTRLNQVSVDLLGPCVELGVEQLWSEDKCKRLVSYIFFKKFESILASYQQPVEDVRTSIDLTKSGLSQTSAWRIEQAMEQCDQSGNELIYKEYWRDSVKPENLNAVCMAERFADQVASDGDAWLEKESAGLIEQCGNESTDRKSYFSCLKIRLDQASEEFLDSCVELGARKLWSEDKCKRIVSYIFLRKFENILISYERPVIDSTETELSLTSTWRIEQAIEQCDRFGNELIYKEYWGDSVKPENFKTVCMAERFADQVAADGDTWLVKSADKLITHCKEKGQEDTNIYFSCLTKNLEKKTQILSRPCKELGEKGLWSEDKCKRLVSYIFTKKFDEILMSSRSLVERFWSSLDGMSRMTLVQFLINPISAILIFILFVLDIVFLIERGTWMRVTRVGLFMGPPLMLACFTKSGMRLLLSGAAIMIILLFTVWNHWRAAMQRKKKESTFIEF